MAEHTDNTHNESTQASMSWDDLMREIGDDAHLAVNELDDNETESLAGDSPHDEVTPSTSSTEQFTESEFESLIEADDLNDLEQQLSMDQESVFEPDNTPEQGLETSDIFDEDIDLGTHDMPDPLLQDALDEELANVSGVLDGLEDLSADDENLLAELDDNLELEENEALSDLLGDLDTELSASDDDLAAQFIDGNEGSDDIEADMFTLDDKDEDNTDTSTLSQDLSELSDILADIKEEPDTNSHVVSEEESINLSSLAQPLVDQMAKLSLSFGQIITAENDTETLYQALKDYEEGLRCFWEQVEKYAGLNHFCQFIQDNSLILAQLSQTERQQYSLLERWPGIMLNYLMIPQESIDELVDYVADEHWPRPLSLKELDVLRSLLQKLAGIPTETISSNSNHAPSIQEDDYHDFVSEPNELDQQEADLASLITEDGDADQHDDYAVMMEALASEDSPANNTDNAEDTNLTHDDSDDDYQAVMNSLGLDDNEMADNHISEHDDLMDLAPAGPSEEQAADYSDMMQALADEHVDDLETRPNVDNTDENNLSTDVLDESLEDLDALTAADDLTENNALSNDLEVLAGDNLDDLETLADEDNVSADVLDDSLEDLNALSAADDLTEDSELSNDLEALADDNLDDLETLADEDNVSADVLDDSLEDLDALSTAEDLTEDDNALSNNLETLADANNLSVDVLDDSLEDLGAFNAADDLTEDNVLSNDLEALAGDNFDDLEALVDEDNVSAEALDDDLEDLDALSTAEDLTEDSLSADTLDDSLEDLGAFNAADDLTEDNELSSDLEALAGDNLDDLEALTDEDNLSTDVLDDSLEDLYALSTADDLTEDSTLSRDLETLAGDNLDDLEALANEDNLGTDTRDDSLEDLGVFNAVDDLTEGNELSSDLESFVDTDILDDTSELVDDLSALGVVDSLATSTSTEEENDLSDELSALAVASFDSEAVDEIEVTTGNADLEHLAAIAQSLSQKQTQLSEQLGQLLFAESESETLLNAASDYSETVQSLWDKAETQQLTGVQGVFDFINANVMALSMADEEQRQNAADCFMAWPEQLIAYLQNGNEAIEPLLTHLQDPAWAEPLPVDQIVILREQLHVAEPVQAEPVDDDTLVLATKACDNDADAISPLSALTGVLTEHGESLNQQLQQIIHTADGEESLLEAVGEYTETLQNVRDCATDEQATGVEMLCDFVSENIMSFAMQSQAEREEKGELFSRFSEQLLDYSLAPAETLPDLLTSLEDPNWSQACENLDEIKQGFGAPAADNIDVDVLADVDDLDSLSDDLDEFSTDTDAEPEPLLAVSDAVLEQTDILTQQLDAIMQAEDESETLLEAVGSYTETVQVVWDAAEQDNAEGVQQLCDFINENVMALGMLGQAERAQSQENFQEWALLLMSYAQLPSEGIDDLMGLLENPAWPQALEDPNSLREQLAVLGAGSSESDDIDEAWVDPLAEFDDSLSLDDNSAAALDPVVDVIAKIDNDLATQLQTLVSADDDSEALLEATSSYTELVQEIWDCAEPLGATGVQSVCDFINENSMALGMLDKSQRAEGEINFGLWSGLLLDYAQDPSANVELLVQQLQDAAWPAPMSAEQASVLDGELKQLGVTASASTSLNTEINLGSSAQTEQVTNTLTAAAEPLSTALEILVSMDNSSDVFLEAIDTYTTHVQAVWDEAEQANLVGLQDVCTFVNDNILMLSAEDTAVRQAVQGQLEQWPMLVLDYLTSPAEGLDPLVSLLQDGQWATPLDAEQAGALRERLQQGAGEGGTADEIDIDDLLDMPAEVEAIPEPEAAVEEAPAEPPADLGVEADEGISLGNAEMLEMLRGEIIDASEDLRTSLEQFVALENDDPAFLEATENYTDVVGRLVMAAEMVGLPGLQAVGEFVIANVTELGTADKAARQAAHSAIDVWPELVLKYLEAPQEHVIALLNHLRESYWPSPLPDERAHELLNSLSTSTAVEEDPADAEPARATQAKPEDVLLQIPEDVNADLWEAFLQEAPQNASEFSTCLQKIMKDPQPEDVKLAQRIAHTLKGSSNIIGIKGIANLAHHLEDILEYLHDNAVPPPPLLNNTLLESADTLEIMVDVLQGKEEPPENALRVLQEVLDWANRIDKGELDVSEEEIKKRKAEIEKATADAPAQAAPGNAPAAAAGGAPAGEAEQYLRVPTSTIDNLLRLIGEMSISVGQIQERLQHTVQHTKSLTSNETIMQQRSYDLETLVDIRDISNKGHHKKMGFDEAANDEKDEDFDSLEFEQYNELHSVTHSFIETIADSRELSTTIHDDLSLLEGMFIQQERLNKEFQQIVMTTRMVPIKTIMSRLERIIRQTCRATSKLSDFEMRGGDILMDGEVLSKLTDPLMHILRNSVDHGMELPEERIAAGKSETGLVVLNCFRLGNNIVVRCEDNGKGLNFDRIKAIAVERGLIKEGQNLSNKELGRLIFVSGFSTKAEVTQVSGRGVGMDVVHTSIQDLKGSVDIDSEPGEGTMISLTLPMSLVTEHVLLVNVNNERFALPTTNLSQALTAESGEFRSIGNNVNFHMGQDIFPVTTLADLLKIHNPREITEDEDRPLVLVKEEGKTTAVLVDSFEDSRDLVSKNMGDYIGKIRGVAGASILGDGSLITLLDLPSLLRTPAKRLSLNTGSSDAVADPTAGFAIPHIMIVDDSLSMRKSLSQLVEDAGFETLLAKDGLEAVEMVGSTKPKIMLVDMEMPRMNGIELTTHIRANAETKDIPIFMITSRTTEKHRQLARDAGVTEYLTKPYQDTELLGLINDALS